MHTLGKKRIAHVSTFPPLRCGIASFASDLIAATPRLDHVRYALGYDDLNASRTASHANITSSPSVAALGQTIQESDCDLVVLQHEFGIWGGSEGENIHIFLDRLEKPLVSVLHTTFGPNVRSRIQEEILRRLIDRSAQAIVLTDSSKGTTEALLDRPAPNIIVLPHGVPDVPYVAPPKRWAVDGRTLASPLRLITPGFFRGDKGIEVVLYALRDLANEGFPLIYRLVGEPQKQFGAQASYFSHIQALIHKLKLQSVVEIEGRYLSVVEQVAAIQQSHVGIFAYQDAGQASSGTVPLVMCVGRPVLCTPFEYARAKALECPGVFLADGYDPDSILSAIKRLLGVPRYDDLTKTIHISTRPWRWSEVGEWFSQLCLSVPCA